MFWQSIQRLRKNIIPFVHIIFESSYPRRHVDSFKNRPGDARSAQSAPAGGGNAVTSHKTVMIARHEGRVISLPVICRNYAAHGGGGTTAVAKGDG